MTQTAKAETAAEMKRRAFYPGEVRAFRVPDTSTVVSIQRNDNGLTGFESFVIMVEKSGVLVDSLRSSTSSEGAARAIARGYINAERVAVVGVVAAMIEATGRH